MHTLYYILTNTTKLLLPLFLLVLSLSLSLSPVSLLSLLFVVFPQLFPIMQAHFKRGAVTHARARARAHTHTHTHTHTHKQCTQPHTLCWINNNYNLQNLGVMKLTLHVNEYPPCMQVLSIEKKHNNLRQKYLIASHHWFSYCVQYNTYIRDLLIQLGYHSLVLLNSGGKKARHVPVLTSIYSLKIIGLGKSYNHITGKSLYMGMLPSP